MATTVLLLKASANRVYGQLAPALATAEARAVLEPWPDLVVRPEPLVLGNVGYLAVDHEDPLPSEAGAVLWNLSQVHAAFDLEGDRLVPLPIQPMRVAPEDVTTIQRYQGKTNEDFTHLLVNLALGAARSFANLLAGERLSLIDPAAGRGTSLNRAVVYGMDATGIEVDQRAVEHASVFFLTWLKDHRMKHDVQQAKLRRGRERPAHRITITYGATKDRSSHRVMDLIHDDTREARRHLKSRSQDLLVCDLPYGVQHGSRTGDGPSPRRDRGPAALLAQALPVWRELLRPGAGVALAWNRRTLSRDTLAGLLVDAGFELAGPAADDSFMHRVDRSITRDAIAARRPL